MKTLFGAMRDVLRHDTRVQPDDAAVPPRLSSAVRDAFDTDFYTSQLPPGSAPANSLGHFLSIGWHQGHDPSASFSTNGYLALNPDVAEAGINPLVHYIEFGITEGRQILPSENGSSGTGSKPANDATPPPESAAALLVDPTDIDAISEFIDRKFYETVSDLSFSDTSEAASHYLTSGWRAGLDPSAAFSTTAYLRQYPDIAHAEIPPLLHYVRAGRAEGRIALDQVEDVAQILAETADLTQMENAWMAGHSPAPTLSDADGAARLSAALDPNATRLVIAFTHDDFRKNRGGVQLCVAREAELASSNDSDYIALYPAFPRPRMAPEPGVVPLYAVVGGTRIGPLHISAVERLIMDLPSSRQIDIVVHVLLGHAAEDVGTLAAAAGLKKIYAWLHDSTFICPSFALQRNLVTYCDAPPPTSSACRMCLYGDERITHLARLDTLARSIDIHAIAPSEAAARMVSTRSDLPFSNVTTIAHATLSKTAKRSGKITGPTTVAFIGAPSRHKGYAQFRHLLRQNLGRDDLRFVYFGAASHAEPGLKTIAVDVTADTPDAMIDALRHEAVDFVIHWAQWEETFSFSTVEAILAGADVLTHPGTGNVSALVTKTGRGHILEDLDALNSFFEPEALAQFTSKRRRRRAQFTAKPSAFSFDAIPAATAKIKGRRP